jgi:signal transduction histidine kinase
MSSSGALSLLVGVLQATLAVVLLRHLGRFGRAFPWLGALMVFFGVRAAGRLYVAFAGKEPALLGYAADAVLVLVLLLLLVGIERMVAGLRLAHAEAHFREQEYARALRDYRTLARHRLANPITAIRGGVLTLKEVPTLTADERRGLLDSIEQEALRLEHVALDPEPAAPEERALHPLPAFAPGGDGDGERSPSAELLPRHMA